MTSYHRLPLRPSSVPVVRELIREGLLLPSEALGAPQGHQVYHLSLPPVPLSDVMMRVGDRILRTEFRVLPSAEYRALLASAPEFEQYDDLETLAQRLTDPATDLRLLALDLEGMVAAGLQTDDLPQLLSPSNLFDALWIPEATHIVSSPTGTWSLLLGFMVRAGADVVLYRRYTMRVTPGVRTVATVQTEHGRVYRFPSRLPDHLLTLRRQLSLSAGLLLDQVVLAVTVQDCEEALHFALRHASEATLTSLFLRDGPALPSQELAVRCLPVWMGVYLGAAGLPCRFPDNR